MATVCWLAGAALAAAGCQRDASRPTSGLPPRLVDVTAESGLPMEGLTSGAVLIDLDGDGRRDLLLGRHALVPEAYRNLGDCRFALMPQWGSHLDVFDHHATLADDLDGDGAQDLYFVVGAHKGQGVGNKVLALAADGYANDVAEAWGVQDAFGRGRGALMLDIEGDGGRDLMVFEFRTAMRAYRLDAPSPKPDRMAELFGFQAAEDSVVATVLEQGLPTLAVRDRSDWVHNLVPQDLDPNGKADYVGFGDRKVGILRFVTGMVRFDLPALPMDAYDPPPVSGAWGDVDNDGQPELYLALGADDRSDARPRRNRLYDWEEGRVIDRADFGLALGGAGVECAFADLDNNGTADLIVQESQRGRVQSRHHVFLNSGGGRFRQPPGAMLVAPETPGIADGILASDFDYDGDLDLLMLVGGMEAVQPGGGARLYRNELARGNWLNVWLEGGEDVVPYGARVEVVCGELRQTQQYWPYQVSGSAFPEPLHFGLGSARRVDELTVYWPSRIAGTVTKQKVNRDIVLRSPEAER